MRITFLVPHLRIAGGVRAILTYADRLAGRGHQVKLAVPTRRRLAFRRHRGATAPDWMPALRAEVCPVTSWGERYLPDADAVVATAWQSAPFAAAAPARCGRKLYFIQHYESLYHGEPARVDDTYRLPLAKVVISTWLADLMRERFGAAAEVIVTPVDPELFHRVPVEPDTGRLRVLMLQHDYAWKGVADGLEAVAAVRRRHPEMCLVGFGVKRPRGPLPYDEFHENLLQPRLAGLYSSCPIYLCPSWDEGLGMPAMEAMACGAALCTYDNGGCRDYALPGETALVAPRRDVGALAAALEKVITDPALRARLASQGQAFILTRFHWDRATAGFEELLGRQRVAP